MWLGGQRRFYYPTWFQNHPKKSIGFGAFSGFAAGVYFWNLETVPYTKRKHFVMMSRSFEGRVSDEIFKLVKEEDFVGKILPENHPTSIRVRLIANNVMEAALKHQNVHKDLGYSSEGFDADNNEEGSISVVPQQHGDEFNWEVIVVNEPKEVNAMCMPGGKVVVFTGLLDYLKTDAEIAVVIGHEVAHAVARHVPELISKLFFCAILLLILNYWRVKTRPLKDTMGYRILMLPLHRRLEYEADYIGMQLMASAGYDPHIAPKFYEKLDKISGGSEREEYLSTHPCSKKRVQVLSQPKVMKEAMSLYQSSKMKRDEPPCLEDISSRRYMQADITRIMQDIKSRTTRKHWIYGDW